MFEFNRISLDGFFNLRNAEDFDLAEDWFYASCCWFGRWFGDFWYGSDFASADDSVFSESFGDVNFAVAYKIFKLIIRLNAYNSSRVLCC